MGLKATGFKCKLCGAYAEFRVDEGVYRHANQPFEDASTFCDKYGYPIPVDAAHKPGAETRYEELLEQVRKLPPPTPEQEREAATLEERSRIVGIVQAMLDVEIENMKTYPGGYSGPASTIRSVLAAIRIA